LTLFFLTSLCQYNRTPPSLNYAPTDRLRALETDWAKCDETWQGDAKEQFTNGFERTKDAVDRSLEVGERAVDWLERFHEIVEKFERQR
jgi:uncharacterized protein YukE